MALVFENTQDIPQTHVFIIGVGKYPYLSDGDTPVYQRDEMVNGLGQLSSPPISAMAFYQTILQHANKGHLIKPLGSIEMLISAAGPFCMGREELHPQGATLDQIRQSYAVWKKHCDSHPDNVAIFYFCGHGLEKEQQYLLAEDFGRNSSNPWIGAFNFDYTRLAFHECRARTQVFLIDACRMVSREMLQRNIPVMPLENPRTVSPDCQYKLVLKAAAASEKAYSAPGEISFFTQAIIQALSGGVARKEGGQWVVSTSGISADIHRLLLAIEPSQGFPQRCDINLIDSANLLTLSEDPMAELEISCQPDDALPLAELSCTHSASSVGQTRQPQPEPWLLPLPAGIYKLQARFINKEFTDGTIFTAVNPPLTTEKISCL